DSPPVDRMKSAAQPPAKAAQPSAEAIRTVGLYGRHIAAPNAAEGASVRTAEMLRRGVGELYMSTWPTPLFSKADINRAGGILALPEPSTSDAVWAYSVLSNWRASHSYPINTFQITLREKLRRLGYDAIVAQRLKRASSIVA